MPSLPSQLYTYPDARTAALAAGAERILSEYPNYNPSTLPIYDSPLPVHPEYATCLNDWQKWRAVYESGHFYLDRYLKHFSRRETSEDFNKRREITPDGSFASEVIDEIKNSIFQRLNDVTRDGGSDSYQEAVKGNRGGVDLRGGSLNWFIGHCVLPELLVLGKIGIYVDAPSSTPALKSPTVDSHPYFYTYKAEDILNWSATAVLLRHNSYLYDADTNLPLQCQETFRLIYETPNGVVVRIYERDNKEGWLSTEIPLTITKLPFVHLNLTKSLIKSVANTQIALTNLESSDIAYALKANFPFYIEQYDTRMSNAPYLRTAQEAYIQESQSIVDRINPEEVTDGGISCEVPPTPTDHIEVGATQGRKYPIGTNAPAFIHPSPEPMKVSMDKQENLKRDIRQLVHLALSTVQAKAVSAESKAVDQQGLEAGLSYIGLELENGERQLASLWQEYEQKNKVATVNYPKRWSLKTLQEINDEVKLAQSLRDDVPSITYKREMNKNIANITLGSRVSTETFNKINSEIDRANGASSNPQTIASDITMGLTSTKTGSILRGYPESEADAAAVDHAARLQRIQQSQTGPTPSPNPAARGLPDLAVDPQVEAAQEKANKAKRGVATK